jgi:hypothetical protein
MANGIIHIDHAGLAGNQFITSVGGIAGSNLARAVRGILFDPIGTFGGDMLVTTIGARYTASLAQARQPFWRTRANIRKASTLPRSLSLARLPGRIGSGITLTSAEPEDAGHARGHVSGSLRATPTSSGEESSVACSEPVSVAVMHA